MLQEKEEAQSKLTALQEDNNKLKEKYDKLVEDSDQMRLLNGKLLLQQTSEDKDDKKVIEEPKKSLEETVIDILNMK